jgi:hypothetical protein
VALFQVGWVGFQFVTTVSPTLQWCDVFEAVSRQLSVLNRRTHWALFRSGECRLEIESYPVPLRNSGTTFHLCKVI